MELWLHQPFPGALSYSEGSFCSHIGMFCRKFLYPQKSRMLVCTLGLMMDGCRSVFWLIQWMSYPERKKILQIITQRLIIFIVDVSQNTNSDRSDSPLAIRIPWRLRLHDMGDGSEGDYFCGRFSPLKKNSSMC